MSTELSHPLPHAFYLSVPLNWIVIFLSIHPLFNVIFYVVLLSIGTLQDPDIHLILVAILYYNLQITLCIAVSEAFVILELTLIACLVKLKLHYAEAEVTLCCFKIFA